MRCSAIKAFVHLTDDGWWREVMARAPSAYGVVVDGERSDNADMSNPRGDAEAGAQMLATRPHAPRRIMGKNELLLSTSSADHWQRWLDYHIAYRRRAKELGFHVAMGALNTGHPDIDLFGGVNQWPRVQPLDDEMDNDDCWDLHSYWSQAGPLGCWPWTAGRHMRCPTKHKILIGECGFDQAVFSNQSNGGWMGRMSQSAYVSQLIEYHRLLTDPRIVGTCIFLQDYDNPTWASWDITPLVDELVSRYGELATPHPLATMPYRLTKPIASERITQTFAQHQANNPLGGWGVDWSAVIGTPVLAAAEGIVDRVEDQGATGYGKWVQVNHFWGFTRYAHLSAQAVAKGDRVVAGARVGLSGNTGNSTAGHLHFELIPFNNHVWPYRVDPMIYLNGGSPVPIPEETIRNAGYNAAGVAYNPDAALVKFAHAHGFGAALGNETEVEGYIVQPFRDAILYVLKNDWANVKILDW